MEKYDFLKTFFVRACVCMRACVCFFFFAGGGWFQSLVEFQHIRTSEMFMRFKKPTEDKDNITTGR